jgi:DNA-directed RNA polymerase specialized sigma24 family protein
LAKEFDIPPKKLASRLYRLRQYLKKALEEEGIRL